MEPDDPEIKGMLGEYDYNAFREEVELLEGAGEELDLERVAYWQDNGAQLSDRVRTLVSEARAAAS